ncbi:MAG: hypothetical protein AB8G22_03660 [Saprospiraceae bacterium]
MNIQPFKLERYYPLYEHTAKYSTCNSDCEAMTVKDLLAMEEGAEEHMTFADQAIKKQSVLILPGGIYDYPSYFRIGFGRKKLPESLEVFGRFVEEHLVGR